MLNRHAPRRRWVTRATAATMAAVVVVAGACTRNDTAKPSGGAEAQNSADGRYINVTTSAERPVAGGSLVYGISADTNSWNPAQAQWASYSLIEARTIFEFLTEFDDDGNIKPYVAESLTPSPDFKEWRVKLRDGIKFSNGKDLTAEAVTRAQRYVRSSQVVGGGIRLVKDWRVEDRLTFVAVMDKPNATYPHQMLSQLGAIAEPDWLETNNWQGPIGTGPFQVDNWALNSSMTVKRNPYYWRKDQWGTPYPYLDSIEFRVIPDERERASALRLGEIDIMLQTLASPDVVELRKEARDGSFQSFSDDGFESAEDHVVLNTEKAPFDDPDARRALALAVDQQAYVDLVTGGLNTPADGAVAPSSPWYEPTGYPAYDPGKARELVEKVKAKPENKGTFEFDLDAQGTPEAQKMQQWLVDAWAKVGITAKPNVVDNRTKILRMVGGTHTASIVQLYDSPAPLNDAVFWPGTDDALGTYSLAFARLEDPQLQALFEEANTSDDREHQHKTQAQIQRRLGELVPFVWLGHVSRTVVAARNLVDVVNHTLPDGSNGLDFMQGSHALYQVWRKR